MAHRSARHASQSLFASDAPPPPPLPPPLQSSAPTSASAACGFAELPEPVALRIFATLPADDRARCGRVCRAWREQLITGPDAARLWTARLDLSLSSGITCARGDATLEGAAALARGGLEALKLTDDFDADERYTFTHAALLRVVAANQRLRDLVVRCCSGFKCMSLEQLQALLHAAGPDLQRLDVGVATENETGARALLRREPPYGAVRVVQLVTNARAYSSLRTAAGVCAFAAAVAACASLRRLLLYEVHLETQAAIEALVDAVRSRRLVALTLWRCSFTAGVLPQLARLLADDGAALADLRVLQSNSLFATASEADVAAFCAALRRNVTLRTLMLRRSAVLQPAAVAALEAAFAERPAPGELLL